MAQDTAQAKQDTKRAHWWTGAEWPRTLHTRAHVGRPRDRKEPTPHGSGALGRPSRPTRPAAGAVPQGHWSEPGQAASGTTANVTWSHGSNR